MGPTCPVNHCVALIADSLQRLAHRVHVYMVHRHQDSRHCHSHRCMGAVQADVQTMVVLAGGVGAARDASRELPGQCRRSSSGRRHGPRAEQPAQQGSRLEAAAGVGPQRMSSSLYIAAGRGDLAFQTSYAAVLYRTGSFVLCAAGWFLCRSVFVHRDGSDSLPGNLADVRSDRTAPRKVRNLIKARCTPMHDDVSRMSSTHPAACSTAA